ncbi:peptidylprolyl isomerase [Candidatus Pacearchaeota archaeon CG_4_9_14_0_2_um_filter_39_13]|nr:peptidylprolyl isomerase [Candidatus Pacearchaeota archaeon]OIO43229.1 MAG: peptidylprolyl isomerase [Candidatus Pacearchaeota archaeon CG1_02_39_14]PJC44930.1 MAG: peptidylprolyl isomerase [Candidatus Pacearchaeota archaeon CG_4_9_14_0_2_um_filter_39_13]
MKVKKGDKIKVSYEGRFEDGTVFDSSEKHGQPLEFIAGVGQVVPGFDKEVIGMEKGEEKEIVIEPKEGYGELNPDLRKAIPRDMLPKDQEPKEGMILMMQAPNGQQFPAKITKVDEKTITIDLNHPLAGKKLMFKIKMEDIDSGDKGIESKV